MITVKSPDEVRLMRAAGVVVARAIAAATAAAVPGATTADLDAVAERVIRDAGAVPSFLGYHGFPATLCTSVNDEVVHGIPRPDKVLRDGDVVSIDCGAIVDGWHADAAVTVPVGDAPADVLELIEQTEQALWRGLAAARPGNRLGDISAAVEGHLRPFGYGIVADYTGHGIGRSLHEDPAVPNVSSRHRGPALVEGLVLAVEPMANLGTAKTRVLPDGWTVVTRDGRPSAHFEHTVAVTADGPWVLTDLDGGRDRFAALATAG